MLVIDARVDHAAQRSFGEIRNHLALGPHQHVIVGDPDFEDLLDPFAELIGIFLRYAQHMGDETHRDFLRILDCGIAVVFAADPSYQLTADITGARLVATDHFRRESGK
jgi:hypothetical protein